MSDATSPPPPPPYSFRSLPWVGAVSWERANEDDAPSDALRKVADWLDANERITPHSITFSYHETDGPSLFVAYEGWPQK